MLSISDKLKQSLSFSKLKVYKFPQMVCGAIQMTLESVVKFHSTLYIIF